MAFLSFPSWAIPASLQKRLVKFLLKRAIGQFVQEDLETTEHLDIQLSDGRVVLQRLHLNVQVLNEICHGLPVRVQEGVIGTISVRIPWSNLWTGNCELLLQDVTVTLERDETPDPTPHSTPSTASSDDVQVLSSSLHFADDFLRSETNQDPRDSDQLLESMLASVVLESAKRTAEQPVNAEPSVQGLQILTEMVDKIISRVNVRLRHITATVVGSEESASFCLHIPQLDYEDCSALNLANPPVGTDAESDTQWFQKVVRFSSIQLTTSEPSAHVPPTPATHSAHTLCRIPPGEHVIELDFERRLPFHTTGQAPTGRPLQCRVRAHLRRLWSAVSPAQICSILSLIGASTDAPLSPASLFHSTVENWSPPLPNPSPLEEKSPRSTAPPLAAPSHIGPVAVAYQLSIQILVDEICGLVLRQPTWWDPSAGPMPTEVTSAKPMLDRTSHPHCQLTLVGCELTLTMPWGATMAYQQPTRPRAPNTTYGLQGTVVRWQWTVADEQHDHVPVVRHDSSESEAPAISCRGSWSDSQPHSFTLDSAPLTMDLDPVLMESLLALVAAYTSVVHATTQLPPTSPPQNAQEATLGGPWDTSTSRPGSRAANDQSSTVLVRCPRVAMTICMSDPTVVDIPYKLVVRVEDWAISNQCTNWRTIHASYGRALHHAACSGYGGITWARLTVTLNDELCATLTHCSEHQATLGVFRRRSPHHLAPLAQAPPVFSIFDFAQRQGEERVRRSAANDHADSDWYKRRCVEAAEWVVAGHIPVLAVTLDRRRYQLGLGLGRAWSRWLVRVKPQFPGLAVGSDSQEMPPILAPVPWALLLLFNQATLSMQAALPNVTQPDPCRLFHYRLTLQSGELGVFSPPTAVPARYLNLECHAWTLQDLTNTDKPIPIVQPTQPFEAPTKLPMLSAHALWPALSASSRPRIAVVLHWLTGRATTHVEWVRETLSLFAEHPVRPPDQATSEPLLRARHPIPDICVAINNSSVIYQRSSIDRTVACTAGTVWVVGSPSLVDTLKYDWQVTGQDLAVLQQGEQTETLKAPFLGEAMCEMDSGQYWRYHNYVTLLSVSTVNTVFDEPDRSPTAAARPPLSPLTLTADQVQLDTCSDSLADLPVLAQDIADSLRQVLSALQGPVDSPGATRPSAADSGAYRGVNHGDAVQSALSEALATPGHPTATTDWGNGSSDATQPWDPGCEPCDTNRTLALIDEYYSESDAVSQASWDEEWIDHRELGETDLVVVADYSTLPPLPPLQTDDVNLLPSTASSGRLASECDFLSADEASGAGLPLQSQYFAPPVSDTSVSDGEREHPPVAAWRVQCQEFCWQLHDGFDWPSASASCLPDPPVAALPKRSALAPIVVALRDVVLHGATMDPQALVAQTLAMTIGDVEVIDNVASSGWHKFMTYLRSGAHQHPREQNANMSSVHVTRVRPDRTCPGDCEYRVEVVQLPLRFYVDQDTLIFALNFLIQAKAILSASRPSKDAEPAAVPPPTRSGEAPYIQYCHIAPFKVKVDYKPKQLGFDQVAHHHLFGLINLFPLQDAKMVLKEVSVYGVSGWDRLAQQILSEWIPHITHTQIPSMVSGVSPIRSLVTLGSGMADLFILPIEQYRQDGRVVKGLQSGARSFKRTTASEAIKLATKVSSTAQRWLETATDYLETRGDGSRASPGAADDDPLSLEAYTAIPDRQRTSGPPVSRFVDQPTNLQEGLQQAYSSLSKNFGDAAHTILAIPVEVYERSSQGTMQAVLRAVPVAVLKPMIGTSEALSKTLLGLRNTLDPSQLAHMEDQPLVNMLHE
ncbi:autophagy- protein 2 [Dimargaris verticillata]|uniref:Autophagy-related protein 2 n=1 Tax=Dimargaris verticillata TaxID=2761393 RepID=A0A9W8EA64_9FUNG|nr:autophagy- protein 2 [Dimargaris verticillata]